MAEGFNEIPMNRALVPISCKQLCPVEVVHFNRNLNKWVTAEEERRGEVDYFEMLTHMNPHRCRPAQVLNEEETIRQEKYQQRLKEAAEKRRLEREKENAEYEFMMVVCKVGLFSSIGLGVLTLLGALASAIFH